VSSIESALASLSAQVYKNIEHIVVDAQSKDGTLEKIKELVQMSDIKKVYRERREKLLAETIDVSAFLIWIFENNPESVKEYSRNPRAFNNRFIFNSQMPLQATIKPE
jgi:glycosyltransferase involved in cell wall biosynthesis